MHSRLPLLATLLACPLLTLAQTTPETDLSSVLSSCTIACLTKAIEASGCAQDDAECVCLSPEFADTAAECLVVNEATKCPAEDLEQYNAFAEAYCGNVGGASNSTESLATTLTGPPAEATGSAGSESVSGTVGEPALGTTESVASATSAVSSSASSAASSASGAAATTSSSSAMAAPTMMVAEGMKMLGALGLAAVAAW